MKAANFDLNNAPADNRRRPDPGKPAPSTGVKKIHECH